MNRRRRRSAFRARVATGATLVIALSVGVGVPTAMADEVDPQADLPAPGPAVTAPAIEGVPADQRAETFGSDASSTDRAFSLAGNGNGVTLLAAEGSDGFEWAPVAQLVAAGIESDRWVGNFCLTADAAYAGIVYGPRNLANDERLFNEGAWGAIVNTKTGDVQDLGRGYSLAYFNPGCGAGSSIAFSRFDGETTYLGAANAATGLTDVSIALPGQITSAITAGDDSFYAAGPEGLIEADASGAVDVLAETTGPAFDLTINSEGGLAYVEPEPENEQATVQYLQPGKEPVELASGALTDLGVTRDGLGNAFVLGEGAATATDLPRNVKAASDIAVDATLSVEASVAVESVEVEVSTDAAATPSGATATIDARSLATSRDFTLSASLAAESPAVASSGVTAPPSGPSRRSAATGSPSNPSETERACAIPRNDIRWQAYQPMPRQVEWAVNRVVRGELTEQRPANWRNLGMAAYSPQGMFPRQALTGGGQIPDQVLLGVLMQESNMWQASRYTSPGLTGNPLIGSYYGISHDVEATSPAFWSVDFDSADCGYGVGQITDGMRLASKSPANNPALPTVKQQAIAVDYGANIARAQQMLADKWNQLQAKGITINNNDPSKIENWFGAVWIYNTGYAGPDALGYEGLGWLNNPANPIYPANRLPFLDGRPADASHPQDWPYAEKVLGFAAHAQGLVERQTAEARVEVSGFRTASWNGGDVEGPRNRAAVKPPLYIFCTPEKNACNGALPGACTRADLHCWFKSNATWKTDCATTCGVPFYRFTPASSYMTEASASVGKAPSFPPVCARTGLPSAALIVDDIPLRVDGTTVTNAPVNPACGTAAATTGSFGFDFGQQRNGSYPSKIDTHQLGGGFNAHFWFSHTRGNTTQLPSTVTGKWDLGRSLAGQWTRVYVHTPDHAGWTQQAVYEIDKGNGDIVKRSLPQRTYQNEWRSLGVLQMTGNPKVTLSNVTRDGSDWLDDIAWDAVAFEPLAAKPRDFVVSMGDSFSSGEGAPSPTGRPYYADSDNYGTDEDFRNACHRSKEAWTRKATLPTSPMTIGSRADNLDASMDFHQISCSGALTENIRSANPIPNDLPTDGQPNGIGRFGELTQIDQGYLDANTTLVTLTVGGNDIGFKDVLTTCLVTNFVSKVPCAYVDIPPGESLEQKTNRKADEVVPMIKIVLAQIQKLAPNAKIVILGYPPIFQDGVGCVAIGQLDNAWLNEMAVHLNKSVEAAAAAQNSAAHPVYYADPAREFAGRNVCSSNPAINGLMTYDSANRGYPWNGDKPMVDKPNFSFGVSQQSVHPNTAGTTLYKNTLERALAGRY